MNENRKGLLGLAFLAGLGVLCSLLAAPYIPLVDPDEGLHAAIAQKMVESGDWLVPRMLDEPFLDKPILYFWAIAASLRIFGMSAAAVRLPGVLFGLLGTLTTAAVAWRMLGRRTGLIAGLFYASMILPVALVQLPAHDAALIPWVNLALLCLWESDCGGSSRRAWAWTAAAGVALGLAILTKGLAGVAMVGIAYGGYLIVSRRLRFIHCFRAALALTVAAIIGSSWYLAVEHANRVSCAIISSSATCSASSPVAAARHGAVVVLLSHPRRRRASLGRIPARIGSRCRQPLAERKARGMTDARRQPAPVVAGLLVHRLHALSHARAFEALHVYLAGLPGDGDPGGDRLGEEDRGRLSDGAKRWMGRIVWSTCLIGPLGLPATLAITQIALPTRFSPAAWTLAVAAALTSLAPLWSWSRGRDRLTLGLAVAAVCGQMAVLLLCALPQVAAGLSGRDLAAYFNRSRELPSRVLMAQERLGSFVFYLDRDLRSRLQPGQMAEPGYRRSPALARIGHEEWIVIPERHLQRR